MSGVNSTFNVSIAATLEGTADFGVPTFAAKLAKQVKYTPGTATVNQADLLFADARSLASAATENLDLAGTLVSPLGATLTFAEVTGIYIENTGNTDITIGNAASNGFVGPFGAATHTITIPSGEVFTLTNKAGWTVTAGTADILKVVNASGATGTYNIVIVGRSVAA